MKNNTGRKYDVREYSAGDPIADSSAGAGSGFYITVGGASDHRDNGPDACGSVYLPYGVDVTQPNYNEQLNYNDNVWREFHFYKSGSLHSGNLQEVDMKGLLHLADMDKDEGYTLVQTGDKPVWMTNPSSVHESSVQPNGSTPAGQHTYLGYYEVSDDEQDDETARRDNGSIYVEFKSTVSAPLTLRYWGAGMHGSELNLANPATVTYHVANEPNHGDYSFDLYTGDYANYRVIPSKTDHDNYRFDGWYLDSNYTQPVSSLLNRTFAITQPAHADIYGKYVPMTAPYKVQHFKEVEDAANHTFSYNSTPDAVDNGTAMIGSTATGTPKDYSAGGYEVDYGKNGNFTATVAADGSTTINIYYKLRVHNPPVVKHAYVGSTLVDNKEVHANDTITYTISVTSDSDADENFTIEDTLPAKMNYVSSSDSGSCSNGKVAWNVTIGAKQTKIVSFNAIADTSITDPNVNNSADAVWNNYTYHSNNVPVVLTAPYVVNHFKEVDTQTVDDTTNTVKHSFSYKSTPDKSDTFEVKVGDSVTGKPYDYSSEGYEVDYEKNNNFTATVTADGKTTINIYYKLRVHNPPVSKKAEVNGVDVSGSDTYRPEVWAGETIHYSLTVTSDSDEEETFVITDN